MFNITQQNLQQPRSMFKELFSLKAGRGWGMGVLVLMPCTASQCITEFFINVHVPTIFLGLQSR